MLFSCWFGNCFWFDKCEFVFAFHFNVISFHSFSYNTFEPEYQDTRISLLSLSPPVSLSLKIFRLPICSAVIPYKVTGVFTPSSATWSRSKVNYSRKLSYLSLLFPFQSFVVWVVDRRFLSCFIGSLMDVCLHLLDYWRDLDNDYVYVLIFSDLFGFMVISNKLLACYCFIVINWGDLTIYSCSLCDDERLGFCFLDGWIVLLRVTWNNRLKTLLRRKRIYILMW